MEGCGPPKGQTRVTAPSPASGTLSQGYRSCPCSHPARWTVGQRVVNKSLITHLGRGGGGGNTEQSDHTLGTGGREYRTV